MLGPEWNEAVQRLERYGVLRIADALRETHWTPEQVSELLDFCESEQVGDLKAVSRGMVFWSLRCGEPGTRPRFSPEYKGLLCEAIGGAFVVMVKLDAELRFSCPEPGFVTVRAGAESRVFSTDRPQLELWSLIAEFFEGVPA